MINMLDQLPEGILDVDSNQLNQFVENLTLVHIKGTNKQPLFISILQHGDETTGWDAMKSVLKAFQDKLPRTIYLLFGNVEAAAKDLRSLDSQLDFNRCWPGRHNDQSSTAQKMTFITEMMEQLEPFASVDIHNNSGRNPHYGGINSMEPEFVHLASMFAETIIHFTSPDGIQSGAFAPFCPAVTIECGLAGTVDGIEETVSFLTELIHLNAFENSTEIAAEQQVLNIFSTVKAKPEINIGIEGDDTENVEFSVCDQLDHLNFQMVKKGTVFGRLSNEDVPMPLVVSDQIGNDITALYFEQQGHKILTKQNVIPAMITQSAAAIRLDCLCYFMHPNNEQIQNQPQ